MEAQPLFSNDEWVIIIRLLEQELEELPSEIHHTYSSGLRLELQEQRNKIESMFQRVKEFTSVSAR